MSKYRNYSEDELRAAVANSTSYRQALQKLGLAAAGGNYATIKLRIKELELDVSHMTGQSWLKGKKNPHSVRKPLEEVLVADRPTSSHSLKKRLIEEGVFVAECKWCELTEWRGQSIPLELDHINGKHDDNRLENLRLLCPNCHAQTDTYRGKNKQGGVAK